MSQNLHASVYYNSGKLVSEIYIEHINDFTKMRRGVIIEKLLQYDSHLIVFFLSLYFCSTCIILNICTMLFTRQKVPYVISINIICS